MSIIGNLTSNTTSSSQSDQWSRMFFPMVVLVPVLGLPTNAYVLWLLLRKPGLCSTTEIFMVNLAVLDTLCCLMLPVEMFSTIFSSRRVVFRFFFLNQFAGPLFQTCMCLDCYLGVLHPVVFLKFKMPKFRLALCAIIWVTTACNFTSALKLGGLRTIEWIAGFLIAELCIMIVCNLLVLRALKQRGPGCQQVHPAKLKAQRTILALLIMVLVHYVTPVVNFLMIVYNMLDKTSPFSIVAIFITGMSCSNHPIFYLFRANKTSCLSCKDKVKKPIQPSIQPSSQLTNHPK